MRDMFGRTIAVGDWVAYPSRWGSVTKLVAGVVSAIDGNKLRVTLVRESYGFATRTCRDTFTTIPGRAVKIHMPTTDELEAGKPYCPQVVAHG